MDGKLDCRRGQINALGGLVYLQDSKTNQKFLVDTGAAVSVLPHTSGPPLSGADGKAIPSWGSVRKTLNFGIRTFLCTFILAAVSKPILGVDFLSANRLLVDPHFGQVLDATTLDPISGSGSAPRRSGLAASLCHVMPEVRALLTSFPAIVGDGSGTPNPKHGVFAKARRLDPEKLRIAEKEFRNLEKAGIVRRSNSPWSSPLHMVPKPDGSWRPCGDYRRLNLATKHDRYPLPSIQDLSTKLHGCKFFSVVDLVKGYHPKNRNRDPFRTV
jgi:cleavage and polyadenylation specificity factor subunit 1